MGTSDIIRQIESIRSEIKNQQLGQISRTDLLEKFKQLLKKVEEELKQNDDAKRLLEEIVTMIKQMEENINAKFESSTQMFEKWDKTLENVADGVKNLDKRLEEVEKDLKEMNDALHFGQAGFLFEQKLARYVLPEGTDVGTINVYKKMLKWLNEEASEEKDGDTEKEKEAARIMAKEKEEAKKRWEEVKGMVNWHGQHEDVLKYMKRQRINVAHPSDVDLKRVKNLVNNHHISMNEKECCLGILRIIEELSLRESGTQSQ